MEYRLVGQNGTTAWRPIPKEGVFKEARKAAGSLGGSVSLEIRETNVAN